MSHPTKLEPEVGRGEERLPRRLGVWSAAAVLVGSTIGSGIFRVPSAVAADAGSVGAALLVWVAGAVQRRFWSGDDGRRSRLEVVAEQVCLRDTESEEG